MNRLDNAAVFAVTALGIEPHEAQLDYLLDDHQTKVIAGGRRSGKTSVLAMEIIYKAVLAIHENRPYQQLIAAPSVDQAKILFNAVVKLLVASPLGGVLEDQVASPFPELRLSRGGKIFLRAAHDGGRLLRGHSAHRVICDEAACLQDNVIEESVGPILADTGGQLVLGSSPAGKGSLFWRLWDKGKDGADDRVRSFKMKSIDNPHIDRAYIEAQRSELTEAQFAAEYLGEFVDLEGAVFKWDQVRACIDGGYVDAAPGARRFSIGWDPARVRDRSGVAVIDVTKKPWRVVDVADLRGVNYVEQVRRVADLARRYERAKVTVDVTNESTLLELLKREGTWADGVRFTATNKADMVMGLQILFERRELVLLPEHHDLLRELRFYEAVVAKSGHVRYGAPDGSKIHDDLVTAVALGVRGAGGAVHRGSFVEAGLPPFITSSTPLHLGAVVSTPGDLPDDWGPLDRF
jgi:hypothetical protein